MYTVDASSNPIPSWIVRADERFLKQFSKAIKNAGNGFQRNLRSSVDAVCENPLSGERKHGRLGGIRGLHVEELVLLWTITPTVGSREYVDDVEEVYLVGLVHHDSYNTGMINKSPATPEWDFVAVLRAEQLSSHHSIYDVEEVEIDDEHWFNKEDTDGVIIEGTYAEGRESALENALPQGAGLSTIQRVAPDSDIGVKVRRVIGADTAEQPTLA